MFERFSEQGRQVVVLAQEEARALKHGSIGTEHLLLALLREEEGIGARALGSLGVGLDEAREHVRRMVGEGDDWPSTGQVPFTPEAKRVLERALREALSLGHNEIGTEHVLLGLARETDGVAARVLLEFGVDGERIRAEVAALLPGPSPEATVRRARRPKRWRYLVEPLGAVDTNDELERLGTDGWELVAIVGEAGAYRGVFKRRS